MSDAREIDLALLFADLSGYTALTETHGALRASEIVLGFCRLAEESVEPGVRVVNAIGDEVFCAGEELLAVVRTALRLQERVRGAPEFPRVRMGIHRGPVIEREGRLFGAPINLAARLAGDAGGGQILCSASIADAVRALAQVEPRPLGERRFRNVAQPVAVFELAHPAAPLAAVAIDPVCRMQVAIERAAAATEHAGTTYRFCSRECARRFALSPELYATGGRKESGMRADS